MHDRDGDADYLPDADGPYRNQAMSRSGALDIAIDFGRMVSTAPRIRVIEAGDGHDLIVPAEALAALMVTLDEQARALAAVAHALPG